VFILSRGGTRSSRVMNSSLCRVYYKWIKFVIYQKWCISLNWLFFFLQTKIWLLRRWKVSRAIELNAISQKKKKFIFLTIFKKKKKKTCCKKIHYVASDYTRFYVTYSRLLLLQAIVRDFWWIVLKKRHPFNSINIIVFIAGKGSCSYR